jgi:uncharacterized Zn finger protein
VTTGPGAAATVVHPRFGPRRSRTGATTWWGKAWARAVEESAYAERDLVAARALARSGRIGRIALDARGGFVAAVEEGDGVWTVSGSVPTLDDPARDAFVETVAAGSGRVAALLAGDLPHDLVEHAEQAGVELLPYGGELATACTCPAWVDPCLHALAVLHQLTWLVDADPLVLLRLRGLSREDLLARLHGRPDAAAAGEEDRDEANVATGLDAALRAARLLDRLGEPDGPVDDLRW